MLSHAIDTIFVPKGHVFRRLFKLAFAVALLMYHAGDMSAVRAVIESKSLNWDAVLKYKRRYVNQRVRRYARVQSRPNIVAFLPLAIHQKYEQQFQRAILCLS